MKTAHERKTHKMTSTRRSFLHNYERFTRAGGAKISRRGGGAEASSCMTASRERDTRKRKGPSVKLWHALPGSFRHCSQWLKGSNWKTDAACHNIGRRGSVMQGGRGAVFSEKLNRSAKQDQNYSKQNKKKCTLTQQPHCSTLTSPSLCLNNVKPFFFSKTLKATVLQRDFGSLSK